MGLRVCGHCCYNPRIQSISVSAVCLVLIRALLLYFCLSRRTVISDKSNSSAVWGINERE